MIRFVFIDGGVNLKVRGLTGTWGAVGIEMPNFEAKKGDFAKICKNWGGGLQPAPSPRLRHPWCFVHGLRRYQSVTANVSNISFERSKTGPM